MRIVLREGHFKTPENSLRSRMQGSDGNSLGLLLDTYTDGTVRVDKITPGGAAERSGQVMVLCSSRSNVENMSKRARDS